MSTKSRKRLRDDTFKADLAATSCLSHHKRRKVFTLERPARSLALRLDSWEEVTRQGGVIKVEYTTCMSEGSRRRKSQVLITNREEFKAMGKVCSGNTYCDRTGLKHPRWRPTVAGGRVVQFTTGGRKGVP